MTDTNRPDQWKIGIAMRFKAGETVDSLVANTDAEGREEVESIIREVMIWQENHD